jgi:Leucine-rich repeat (LRR) protein
MSTTVSPPYFFLPTDSQPTATPAGPSPSPGLILQPQITPTPHPWPSAHPIPPPSNSYARLPRSAENTAAIGAPNQIGNGGTPTVPSRLSPGAQKLQQLPPPQQDALIQQNQSTKAQQMSLLKAYPSLPKEAIARMQQWVDDTYGSGHDVTKLYLVRYGKDPHGHPSHTEHNPALDREGAPAETIPLWKVLQDNMANGSLFGNDYNADRQEYKIVDASDVGKKYSDARGVLDPEKLYDTRGKVNFKVEHGKAVDRYYREHHDDIAEWAKQRALMQLDVQHATGNLDDSDYTSLKNVLERGEGGKIYTLSLGDNTIGGSGRFAADYTLAGGLRIELPSGRNFTYLPKEEQPYRPFDNDLDAIASIRDNGKDPKKPREFVEKYRSLLGDPAVENPLAVKDMQEATVEGVFRRSHGNFKQLLHGNERDITHDPFGELTAASHANDSQDAWDGIQSDTDIRRATVGKWGNTGLEILATLPVGAEGIGAVVKGGRAALGELAAGEAEDIVASAAPAGAAAGRGTAKTVAEDVAEGSGNGNLGAIDELNNANRPSIPSSNLPPKAHVDPNALELLQDKAVYRDKQGDNFVRIGDDFYQVKYDKQLRGWIAVDPSRPNDFTRGVPVKLDGKGGAEPLPRSRLEGGGLRDRVFGINIPEMRSRLESWGRDEIARGADPQHVATAKRIIEETLSSRNTQLSLQDLGLHTLPEDVLKKLTWLKKADFSFNRLQEVPLPLAGHPSLESLDLSHNSISTIPRDIENTSNLKSLLLNDNRLTEFDAADRGAFQDEHLNLGKLKRLEHLDLSDNHISSLARSFGDLPALKSLHLENNQLRILPPNFGNLSQLESLYLKNNGFAHFNGIDAANKPIHLRHLDLNGNRLSSLPEWIFKLPDGSTVDYGNNPITSIPPGASIQNSRIQLTITEPTDPLLRETLNGYATHSPDLVLNRVAPPTLQEEISRFFPDDTAESWAQGWDNPPERYADSFSELIRRLLTESSEGQGNPERTRERIKGVLKYMKDHPESRQPIFDTAESHIGTCGDNVQLGLSTIEKQIDNYRMENGELSEEQMVDKIIRLHNESIVDDIINQKIRENPDRYRDPVETKLDYMRRLRKAGIKLPESDQNMQYHRESGVAPEDIPEAVARIRATQNSPAMIEFLSHHESWQNLMKKRYAEDYEATIEPFNDRWDKLEDMEPPTRQPGQSEDDYRREKQLWESGRTAAFEQWVTDKAEAERVFFKKSTRDYLGSKSNF